MSEDADRRRRRRVAAIAVVALIAAVALVFALGRGGSGAGAEGGFTVAPSTRTAPRVRAPEGVRIRVEVLNATARVGLARRATMYLRDAGFDVVRTGTADRRSDTTVVVDRSGHPDWARLVAQALGGARIESRPDPSGYLDVTVLLGAAYRPPSEPFYP